MIDITADLSQNTRTALRLPADDYIVSSPIEIKRPVCVDANSTITTNSRLTMKSGSSWIGIGGKHTIIKTGVDSLFCISGNDVSISDSLLDHASSAGGWSFLVDTATTSREHIRLNRIRTAQSHGLISDTGGAGVIVDMHLDDIMAKQHRGRGSYLTRAFAYIALSKCTIDYVNTPSQSLANIPAWVFYNNEGLLLDYVDVTGTAIGGGVPSQYGFYFENCRAITIKHAMADNVGGFGFYFKNCNYVEADTLKASLGADCGVVMAGTTSNVRIDRLYVSGRKGLPNYQNKPLVWTDPTIFNCRSTQTLLERYDTAWGGSAATNFGAGYLVTS